MSNWTDSSVECVTCGEDFTSRGYDNYEADGNRQYHYEGFYPDNDECPGCRGEADCEGQGDVACPDGSAATKTRHIVEDSGSLTWLGVYCDVCWKVMENA